VIDDLVPGNAVNKFFTYSARLTFIPVKYIFVCFEHWNLHKCFCRLVGYKFEGSAVTAILPDVIGRIILIYVKKGNSNLRMK